MTGEESRFEPAEERHRDAAEGDHLDHLPDGSGCTEIWEHLSEQRAAGD